MDGGVPGATISQKEPTCNCVVARLTIPDRTFVTVLVPFNLGMFTLAGHQEGASFKN
jgi:hypothetical protein